MKTVLIRVSGEVRDHIYGLAKDQSEYPDMILRRVLKMPAKEHSRGKIKVVRRGAKSGRRVDGAVRGRSKKAAT